MPNCKYDKPAASDKRYSKVFEALEKNDGSSSSSSQQEEIPREIVEAALYPITGPFPADLRRRHPAPCSSR